MNTALRGTATAELASLRHRGAGSPPATEGTRGRRCSRGRSRGSIIEGQRPLRWPVRVFLGGPRVSVPEAKVPSIERVPRLHGNVAVVKVQSLAEPRRLSLLPDARNQDQNGVGTAGVVVLRYGSQPVVERPVPQGQALGGPRRSSGRRAG